MTKGQGEADSLVVVVDDDASVRQALTSLLQSVGLRVEAFGSAADFLKKGRLADSVAAACLILDIRLPGVSGLDFQAELAKADTHLPIIFISGHGDIPMTVRAMKAGAIAAIVVSALCVVVRARRKAVPERLHLSGLQRGERCPDLPS
jgi:FixJ family two-component response regulator